MELQQGLALSTVKKTSSDELIEKFEEFFRQYYEKELRAASKEGKKSIAVDFALLEQFDPELADALLNTPGLVLQAAEQAILGIDLIENVAIRPRFRNLPEESNIRIRNLRAEHIGKLVSLDGVVKWAAEVKPEIYMAKFLCPVCDTEMEVQQVDRMLRSPTLCTNEDCGWKGKFELKDRKLLDSRMIMIEEPSEIVTAEKPGTIYVYLKEDLTLPEMQRKTDPGNRLVVNGVVKELKRVFKGKTNTQLDILVEANYVEPTEIEWEELIITKEDEKRIKELASDAEVYQKLVSAFAPSIYGLDEIKEAIMLQLFGGVQQNLPDGIKIRGDIHILLIGDPSTAKSQLLKLVSSIIPRGKYASGGGVTGAGLTATVFKDEEITGGWVLEAGALILANKGIMCLDEFDKINKDDQSRLHEALEQQTISIAKASIIATLPAQVSVLAACNPKLSRFDPMKSIADQINIPDTLLSRFDLKFALRDVPKRERDEMLSSHIFKTRLEPESVEPSIPTSLIKKYIAFAKKNCRPRMTKEAAEKLKEFYVGMRMRYGGRDVVPITLRQNEALVRLSEASAKIRLGDVVEIQDAERAINIMEYSLKQLGYDTETGMIDIDRLEGGIPSSKRDKMRKIQEIIINLEKQLGKKELSKEEIIRSAEDEGIVKSDAREIIDRMKTDGDLFEPKWGFIIRTRSE